MNYQRFYDQTLTMIERGDLAMALPVLTGKLFATRASGGTGWKESCSALRNHPLHAVLIEDPYVARCNVKPRGYAGDAPMIDFIYDRQIPPGTSDRGRSLFDITTSFQASEGVRQRKRYATEVLRRAIAEGKSICALACGHFREGEGLGSKELSRVTVVDQDPLSLDYVRERFGDSVDIHLANVFHFLRKSATNGERYDLIYTLGLTDYLDDRAMNLLHQMVFKILNPGGRFLLANFVPDHLAVGWMEAVMDWNLIYRQQENLADFGRTSGFLPTTWLDPTESIAWCENEKPQDTV